MIEKAKNIFSDRINRLFIYFGLGLLIFSAVFYMALGRGASRSLTDQTKQRQLRLAESGANTVEAFVKLFGKSLIGLAAIRPNQTTLKGFMDTWKDTPIGGVILTDTTGRVVANAPREGEPDLGADLSDRDYFVWAKTAAKGDYFVGSPVVSRLGASKDKFIVVVATPLIVNGQFEGVLGASLIIQEMADEYLTPLRISNSTRVYLLASDTTILAGPFPELIGKNTVDYIKSINVPGNKVFADIVGSTVAKLEVGTLDLPLPDFETKQARRFIIVYAPIECCEGKWLLGLMTPAEDLTAFFGPFYFNELAAVVIAFLIFIAISVRLAKSQGFKEGLLEHLRQDREKRGK